MSQLPGKTRSGGNGSWKNRQMSTSMEVDKTLKTHWSLKCIRQGNWKEIQTTGISESTVLQGTCLIITMKIKTILWQTHISMNKLQRKSWVQEMSTIKNKHRIRGRMHKPTNYKPAVIKWIPGKVSYLAAILYYRNSSVLKAAALLKLQGAIMKYYLIAQTARCNNKVLTNCSNSKVQ